jgi:DnaJ-class molecular chaperone
MQTHDPQLEEHDEDEWPDHLDRDCQTCGGDGFVTGYDMSDPLMFDDDEILVCHNCRGSGHAKDQTFW